MKGWLFATLVLAALLAACTREPVTPYSTSLGGEWFSGTNETGVQVPYHIFHWSEPEVSPPWNMPVLHLSCDPELDSPRLEIIISSLDMNWKKRCSLWFEGGNSITCRVDFQTPGPALIVLPEYMAYDGWGHGSDPTIDEMLSHRRMYLEYTSRETDELARFSYDLSGLARAYPPVKASCRLP